jgi:hypothetical protein
MPDFEEDIDDALNGDLEEDEEDEDTEDDDEESE